MATRCSGRQAVAGMKSLAAVLTLTGRKRTLVHDYVDFEQRNLYAENYLGVGVFAFVACGTSPDSGRLRQHGEPLVLGIHHCAIAYGHGAPVSAECAVFGTTSKELGTTAADVVAYFTPVYARAQRTRNVIKAQSAVQVADGVWVIAGLYEFINLAADGIPAARAARFHFVVVREGTQCKIAAFNSSWVP